MEQRRKTAIDDEYRRLPSVSIDNGVMEQSAKAAMVPVAFSWSDVGNWGSLDEVAAKDKAGNVVSGRVVDLEASSSVVYADRRVVATIGLDGHGGGGYSGRHAGLSEVPRAGCEKDGRDSQATRAPGAFGAFDRHRPWGSYTVLEEGPGYKVKRVTVNPGGRLSLQLHHKRSEHWVVIAGTARVTRGEEVLDLAGGRKHGHPGRDEASAGNPGQETLHIIEVQNGPYLGEDDIVRFKDDYGRTARHSRLKHCDGTVSRI